MGSKSGLNHIILDSELSGIVELSKGYTLKNERVLVVAKAEISKFTYNDLMMNGMKARAALEEMTKGDLYIVSKAKDAITDRFECKIGDRVTISELSKIESIRHEFDDRCIYRHIEDNKRRELNEDGTITILMYHIVKLDLILSLY